MQESDGARIDSHHFAYAGTRSPVNWLALHCKVSLKERVSRRIEVKKVWFSRLAVLLGCMSSSTAFGQYPGAYGSLAPSSFPVQQMQPQANYQSFPQVPQTQANQWSPAQGQMSGGTVQRPAAPNQTYASPNQGYAVQAQMVGQGVGQGIGQVFGQGIGQASPQPSVGIQTGGMQSGSMQTSGMQPGSMTPGWMGQRTAPFQLVGAQEGINAVPMHAAPANAIPQNAVPAPVPMQAPMQGVPQSDHGTQRTDAAADERSRSQPTSSVVVPVGTECADDESSLWTIDCTWVHQLRVGSFD